MKKLFITGGTGLLGQKVLQRLKKSPFEVTLGSRTQTKEFEQFHWIYFELENVDIALNLQGFDIILHLASNTADLKAKSDLVGTQQLLNIAKRDGVRHFIFISIVGVDTVPVPYFKMKKKVEDLILSSSLPYSILRSTQFYAFLKTEVINKTSRKVTFLPDLQYQPIEVDIVAQKLIDLSLGKPTNAIEEMGGSEVILFSKAIRSYQKLSGNRALIIRIPNVLLGRLGKALTTEQTVKNIQTWEEYLNHSSS